MLQSILTVIIQTALISPALNSLMWWCYLGAHFAVSKLHINTIYHYKHNVTFLITCLTQLKVNNKLSAYKYRHVERRDDAHSSSSSSWSSWQAAFSRSIPSLQYVARTICFQPAPERRAPEFPCPGRSDESRCWEVDLEHASSRETAGHHLDPCSRSEEC